MPKIDIYKLTSFNGVEIETSEEFVYDGSYCRGLNKSAMNNGQREDCRINNDKAARLHKSKSGKKEKIISKKKRARQNENKSSLKSVSLNEKSEQMIYSETIYNKLKAESDLAVLTR